MKKLFAIAAFALGVVTANADDNYFWWMIYDNEASKTGWDTGWTYARIKAVDKTGGNEATYLTLVPGSGTGGIGESSEHWAAGTYAAANDGAGDTITHYGALVSGLADTGTWSFFLEVYNSDYGWNGMDEGGIAMSEAAAYLYGSGTTTPGAKYDFGAMPYSNVPEPNSAMLLLLGLSALALRRKRHAATAA